MPRLVLVTFLLSDFEKSNNRDKENSKDKRESAYRVLPVHFQMPGGAWEYFDIQIFAGIDDSRSIVGGNRSLDAFGRIEVFPLIFVRQGVHFFCPSLRQASISSPFQKVGVPLLSRGVDERRTRSSVRRPSISTSGTSITVLFPK
jgi:hypothetical protein